MRGGGARLVDDEEHERREHDQAGDDRGQAQETGERGYHIARLDRHMDVLAEYPIELARARERLVAELREHALVIGEVTLTSGARAQYYVDAKRAILRPEGFAALGELVAALVADWRGTAVGGMTMGADPVACAALAGGARAKAFFVRKDTKAHGLQRRIEGPPLERDDRCVVVEDVVTTGGSTLAAIEALKDAGQEICGVISVLDRLAGGGPAIESAAGAPYVALTTVDDIYPDRPDRPAG
jgi:orotate phosphoribosyltransferase